MNHNWLAYQRQIAMLLAATPRTSSTCSETQRMQLQPVRAADELDYERDRAWLYGDSRPPTRPGIRRR